MNIKYMSMYSGSGIKCHTNKHWATFIFSLSRVYRFPRRFPWDTFRPIFQVDRQQWRLYLCPFCLSTHFARLSRSRSPIFPRLIRMTDYDIGLSIYLTIVVDYITSAHHYYARNIAAAGIHCDQLQVGR